VRKLDKVKSTLFEAQDGRVVCKLLNELREHAMTGSAEAKKMLALYVKGGRINHMRDYACACLADSVTEADSEFVALFRNGLSDPALRYWCILGFINSAGKAAYPKLASLAGKKSIPLAARAHAFKCLATFSKQRFDRGLPADPGRWEVADLRMTEVRAWAKSGYQDGEGYSEPRRHAALDKPMTPFEKIVSRLDKKLAKKRQEQQDLADPTNWLAIAVRDDIRRIKAAWDLPSIYLDFLARFSPIKVTLETRKFYNGFQIFGAAELLEARDGYSFNPVEQQPIDDWPAHLVVIANHGGDPVVLDLAKSDGDDAPVRTAEHGVGVWKFRRVADSFREFLQQLAK
jgi:hypothetical protein